MQQGNLYGRIIIRPCHLSQHSKSPGWWSLCACVRKYFSRILHKTTVYCGCYSTYLYILYFYLKIIQKKTFKNVKKRVENAK